MSPIRQFLTVAILAAAIPSFSQATTQPQARESTTIPSDSNYKAHSNWNKECEERVLAVTGKQIDLLFLGDSITQNWTDPDWGGEHRGRVVWAENYANLHALNFGVGADATQNLLWRMDHMGIQTLHPKVAVLLIGVNNYKDEPQAIAAGTLAILRKTQQFYPGIKIILVGILPNRLAYERMNEANTLTRTFADDKTVFYLDLGPLFQPNGDNWVGIGADHLHPNETGYRIWANAMKPLLDKLLMDRQSHAAQTSAK